MRVELRNGMVRGSLLVNNDNKDSGDSRNGSTFTVPGNNESLGLNALQWVATIFMHSINE